MLKMPANPLNRCPFLHTDETPSQREYCASSASFERLLLSLKHNRPPGVLKHRSMRFRMASRLELHFTFAFLYPQTTFFRYPLEIFPR